MQRTAQLPTIATTPLTRGLGQARWMPEARRRRRLTAMVQRLALAAIMVATFILGTAVMVATIPTAEEVGQPLEAPPGLGL